MPVYPGVDPGCVGAVPESGLFQLFPNQFFDAYTFKFHSLFLPFSQLDFFLFIFCIFFALTLCPFVLQGADVTDPGTETEESLGATDSTQRPADSQTPSRKIQEKPVKPIAHT